MSAPQLSLVMGGSTQSPERGEVTLPLPESGTVHLHLHMGEKAGAATGSVKRPLGGWSGLVVGIGVMAAFFGGYQLGHRPAPDDVSNLRPIPALGSPVVPELAMPSAAGGLPAIQRQLATPPQIIPPTRAPQHPSTSATAPSPATPASNRNAFGLENRGPP